MVSDIFSWRCRSVHVLATVTPLLFFVLFCTSNTDPTMESSSSVSSTADTTEEGPYYYVELSTGGASFYTTINGVPYFHTTSAGGAFKASPVNVRLIGEDNVLKIIAGPTTEPDSMEPTTPEEARLTGSIKLYQSEDLFGTEDGKTIETFTLQDTIEARREEKRQSFLSRMEEVPPEEKKELAGREEELTSVEFPIEMTVRFDSPKTPSFAGRLTEAPVIEDTAALKDYAIKLRNLMRRQDSREIYEELEVKNQDYNEAYYESEGYEWWKENLEDYYTSGLRTDFDREDIGLRPLLGGRMWEIYVENGEPDQPWNPTGRKLFSTRGENGERQWSMRVIVGRVDGELRIVR